MDTDAVGENCHYRLADLDTGATYKKQDEHGVLSLKIV